MAHSSKSIGMVLTVFLYVALGFHVTAFICSYFLAFQHDFYNQYIALFDTLISILQLLVIILTIIFYLIWLFKVHKDLNQLDPEYPISSGMALARVMVPFYNVWGIWNVYVTMAKHFRKTATTAQVGKQLRMYIPFYYVLFWVTEGLGRYLALDTQKEAGMVWFVSYGIESILTVFYVLMLKTVTSGIHLKSMALEEEAVIIDPGTRVEQV